MASRHLGRSWLRGQLPVLQDRLYGQAVASRRLAEATQEYRPWTIALAAAAGS